MRDSSRECSTKSETHKGLSQIVSSKADESKSLKTSIYVFSIAAILVVGISYALATSGNTVGSSANDLPKKKVTSAQITDDSSDATIPLVDVVAQQSDIDYISNYGDSFDVQKVSGTGNQDILLPAEAESSFFVVNVSHPNDSVIRIEALSDEGSSIYTILDKLGLYSGTRIGATACSLRISSAGPWEITISPIESLNWLTSSTEAEGDMPFFVAGSSHDIELHVEYCSNGSFQLIQNGTAKHFDQKGPFTGAAVLPLARDTNSYPSIYQVFADGAWEIQ